MRGWGEVAAAQGSGPSPGVDVSLGAVSSSYVQNCCDVLHRVLQRLRQALGALENPPTAGPTGLVAAHSLFTPPLPPGIIVEFGTHSRRLCNADIAT